MKVSSKDIDWWIELGTTQTGALKLAKSLGNEKHALIL